MTFTTFGDAARFAGFGQDVGRVKSDLQRLGTELGSGRKADVGTALRGDFSELSDVRRGLRLSESFLTGLARAGSLAEMRQTALDRLSAEVDGAGPELLSVVSNGRSQELRVRLSDAPDRFEAAIAGLNARLGGNGLFSGTALQSPALADAETILEALRPLAATAADGAAAIVAIDAWFQDAGGGYETIAMLGSTDSAGLVYLGEGRTADAGVTVADAGIRTSLSGLALAALAAEGSIPATPDAAPDIATAAAERMIRGNAGLVDARARLGVVEGRIEAARVEAEAQRAALQLRENGLVAADPFDAATEIEAARLQLESLYVLTARLSNLTLTAFLR